MLSWFKLAYRTRQIMRNFCNLGKGNEVVHTHSVDKYEVAA
jgi:hypothetical protein